MIKFLRAAQIVAVWMVVSSATTRALEPTWMYSVQLGAAVRTSPPSVELSWTADQIAASSFTVFRKAPSDSTWPAEGVALPGDATSFADTNVAPGNTYEYQVVKRGAGFTGYGYISAALEAPLVDDRGRVIVVVDNSIAGAIGGELARFERDLAGDGWTVVRKEVARDANPADVRSQIKSEYEADRARTKAVVLLGHVPVVRSGNLNVDGHLARPMAADVFYGEMNGAWTDANGDGIYDQNQIPTDVELQVGRIDFADLTGVYAAAPYPSEVDLLKRYLDKDNAYRHARVRPALRALIGGHSNAGGQAYAASGYRNAAPTVGSTHITIADTELYTPAEERWIAKVARDDYLWAYGFGAGSDFTAGGLGTHGQWNDLWASDFLDAKAKGTFYLFFGSWFGDWSKPENLLRTALAAPDYGLAAAWAGRPHIFLHQMGVGETIGYGMRLSQNNDGRLYQNQTQRQLRGIHIALLGDPTLRLYAIAPPPEVTALPSGADVVVAWKASPDSVTGYHVYRGSSVNGLFTRLTGGPIGDTRFVDSGQSAAGGIYLVRAVALQSSPSGTYFNASQGTFANAEGVSVAAAPPPPPAPVQAPVTDGGSGEVGWIDDGLPAGAIAFSSENDRWNWVPGLPAPASGPLAHCSEIAAGLHHHFFAYASTPLVVNAGDKLFAYVFLDPANLPRTIMLTWLSDNWEHRAYWGENAINEGVNESAGRRYMGPLPTASQWVRLELPARAVGLEGHRVTGMGFVLFDGRASWDRAGKVTP